MSSEPELHGEIALRKEYVPVPTVHEALTIPARGEAWNGSYEVLADLGQMTDSQVLDVLNEIHSTQEVF